MYVLKMAACEIITILLYYGSKLASLIFRVLLGRIMFINISISPDYVYKQTDVQKLLEKG